VTSAETVAELNRQSSQNRNDIVALHDLLEATNKTVKETKTRVDVLDTKVDQVDFKVDTLRTEVITRVDALDTKVDNLNGRVDTLDTKVGNRFDRLEMLITERSASPGSQPTTGVMRTAQERKVSVLESQMNVYSSQTADVKVEIERHNRMFDAYDDRFNTIDSQMAEVLGILRGTG
jgi:chromosome segregation ATPase